MDANIQTCSLTKLSPKQTKAFTLVLQQANKDKYLSPHEEEEVPKKPQCVVVLYGKEKLPIGYYTPRRESWPGHSYWRSGTVFIVPQYRGKGIMAQVLREFFETHQPGLAWIDDKNSASINLFNALGFVKERPKVDGDGNAGHWYIRPRTKLSAESNAKLPVYFNW